MHALDRRELRHALRREPIEEIRRGARIGATRVRIADSGGAEFTETLGGLLAAGGDDGGNASGDDRGQLVHNGCSGSSTFS